MCLRRLFHGMTRYVAGSKRLLAAPALSKNRSPATLTRVTKRSTTCPREGRRRRPISRPIFFRGRRWRPIFRPSFTRGPRQRPVVRHTLPRRRRRRAILGLFSSADVADGLFSVNFSRAPETWLFATCGLLANVRRCGRSFMGGGDIEHLRPVIPNLAEHRSYIFSEAPSLEQFPHARAHKRRRGSAPCCGTRP